MTYKNLDPEILDSAECERAAYAAGDTWSAGVLARLVDAEREVIELQARIESADLEKLDTIAEMHHVLLDTLCMSLPYVEDAAEFDEALKAGIAAGQAKKIRDLIAKAESI